MGAAAAITGVATGVSNFFQSRKMTRQAQSLIDNFQWQELKNPYKDLQVSTMGSDLQREELARQSATSTEALRSGGTRGLIGGLGRVQANNNLVNRQIGADLDQQRKQIDYATAQDDTRIRDMVESRQANELAGYGQMLEQGRQQQQMGMGQMIGAFDYVNQLGQQGSGDVLSKLFSGSEQTQQTTDGNKTTSNVSTPNPNTLMNTITGNSNNQNTLMNTISGNNQNTLMNRVSPQMPTFNTGLGTSYQTSIYGGNRLSPLYYNLYNQ